MSINFLEELAWRGMTHDVTPGLDVLLSKGPVTAYIGFDPTAPSIHIGNLATLMLLVHFQRCGHKPIVVMGGATGMIGDPSGKNAERALLTLDLVEQNLDCQRRQLARFLDFAPGPQQAEVLNNYDWFQHFRLLDFLRDVGKHLSVNYMMAKDSVKTRLETGLSFTEFSYQLFQAYDFFYLYQHKNCRLQMGGSDQWGNITGGGELIRRMAGGEAHGLTTPLLTKADGTKFGKSETGNIWLDPDLTSPYKFYQYLINTSDADVEKLLRVFSLQPRPDVEGLIAESAERPEARAAQKALAEELTRRVHSQDALNTAMLATEALFGKDAVGALRDLPESAFLEIFEGVPTYRLQRDRLGEQPTVVDLLAEAGVQPSKSEAKRSVAGGGIRINKVKVETPDERLGADHLLNGRYVLVQVGKKNNHILVFE